MKLQDLIKEENWGKIFKPTDISLYEVKFDGLLKIRMFKEEWVECESSFNTLLKLDFTEVKPQIKLSDDEKVILRNLNEEYLWIARDKDGLFISPSKPVIDLKYSSNRWLANGFKFLPVKNNIFQQITFENSPLEIAELIKE